MMWVNPNITICTGCEIVEYDIRHGNTSIMAAFGLKDPETIRSLDLLPGHERQVAVGKLMIGDRVFAKKLEAGFNEAVVAFIKANELDSFTDIIEIRRDAVFVRNRHVDHLSFANGLIVFRPKGTYQAMIHLDHKVDFYRSMDEKHPYKLDGMVRDPKQKAHLVSKLSPGPLSFLDEYLQVVAESGSHKRKLYKWLHDFAKEYKRRNLDIEYYREFNRQGRFRIQDTLYENADDSMMDDLDISFNYKTLVIPILEMSV